MKPPLALALLLMVSTSICAQTASDEPQPTKLRHGTAESSVAKQLGDMKDAIAAQQQQIQQLQQQIATRDHAIHDLEQKIANISAPQPTAVPASSCCDQVDALQHQVADLKAVSSNTVNELQDTQKRVASLESPLAIHYKGITITPGGFTAAETVWRQRATGADINSPLNAINFSGTDQAHVSEFYGSGRQSRISMLAQGNLVQSTITGYLEADFLGAGITSNNNQSNSYVMRFRQFWGQAALHSGWSFTGGQMWSLVTETKVGLDNRTEALPMTIDPQYTVGFSWSRQYGFRVAKNFNNKVWLGFSVENSQETITSHGNANNYLIGQPGNGAGLYNPGVTGCSTTLNAAGAPVTTCAPAASYSYNPSPDFVGKLAFQGLGGHYEIFGVAAQSRDRVYPNATLAVSTAAGAYNSSTWGGGGGGNARWSLFDKHFDLGIHALAGSGTGRYGTAGLPDAAVRPNGTIASITNYQGLLTLEYHSTKWDLYGNGGIEYDERTPFLSSKGAPVGYGALAFNNTGCGVESLPGTAYSAGFSPSTPSNCTGDTKNIEEGTLGFWYKPYNGPKGRMQFGLQYSYLTRTAWAGIGTKTPYSSNNSPTAIDNMFFTSFRYYVP